MRCVLFVFRSMLSAAHVLAMDAKNLLDVVDSVRMRYPQVDLMMRENYQVNDVASSNNEENLSSPSTSEASSHYGYGLPNKLTAA